jgi:hypothetical protein
MTPVPRRRRAAARLTRSVGIIAALAAGTSLAADDQPAVVPYRPSVATPADLPAPGWPEVEAGAHAAQGGGAAHSNSTPVTFKLAWDEHWAVLVGTDGREWQRAYDGSTASGLGNTTLAVKRRWPVDAGLALGADVGVSLPTAGRALGSGGTDWMLNAIASVDRPGLHVDLNLAGTRFGAADTGQGRWQGGWALAGSHPLDGRFAVTGELSGLAQRGSTASMQGLVALSYSASRALVLDVAAAAGLSRAAPGWQLMAGMTVQLGHWF